MLIDVHIPQKHILTFNIIQLLSFSVNQEPQVKYMEGKKYPRSFDLGFVVVATGLEPVTPSM